MSKNKNYLQKDKKWYEEINRNQWKTVIAGGLGWALDSMDVMLYAMVVVHIMSELQLGTTQGGLLTTITLVASGIGGMLFGLIADKWGRKFSLTLSIVTYSLFTAACGFSQTLTQLIVFRFILGLGMGGEWTAGAALVTESWPAKHRGKAMGLMQSCWALGYAVAALITAIILPKYGWRAVFFAGFYLHFLPSGFGDMLRNPTSGQLTVKREDVQIVIL